ncbi:adenosylmethionine-8-amino-7-oxononanoate aminotransferase [Humidesulfovibrio mexicanus]|uniref:Adenosylmethionine-8-amino-7-oxononanoate aminotransferase n=1 Tax=Humidesulfovibrio mexicanus TaxID=147047 RepID=A0A238XU64_9BACT|nr:adenosylmethionine--8-amino-7-oxononanoate transaminase [Humidesulfovibrio mexicanus]SNR61549.1 adenosylmethionine-8-amino-7-oxononanoate aminotransferase [Humidesulfovibrio mexicanus]
MKPGNIVDIDRQCVWHPFTQERTAPPPLPVASARGASLFLDDGRELLDMACSWWVNVHGHSHPKIAAAIARQAATLEHVIFAGFTHGPAVRLAQGIVDALPAPLERVFYSDNGSTAVEVALKMAWQFWRNQGRTDRRFFLAFQGGYHGDTFGAMSVGRTSGYYVPFEDLMCEVRHVPFAATWIGDEACAEREAAALEELDALLAACGDQCAAFLAEPLVQGASGMNMCRPEFLRAVVERMQAHAIPVILDEVMTGFGRTGTMFALEQAGVVPDLVCLSKGISGGFLPLAATVASRRIYESFLGEDFHTAFAHGHSFTANPLGCAAGVASLALFKEEDTLRRIADITHAHRVWLADIATLPGVTRPRALGSIAAVTLGDGASDYHAGVGAAVKAKCFERGLLIRPMGNVVYLMPPACVTREELLRAQEGLTRVLKETATLYAS